MCFRELKATKAFYEVGSALLRIRDSRSYRDQYDTFEAYCRERWDLTHRYVNYKIEAAKAASNVGTIVPKEQLREGQMRVITSLIPDDQRTVIQRVLDSGDKITAKRISAEVAAVASIHTAAGIGCSCLQSVRA